jgi:hypothetical protein
LLEHELADIVRTVGPLTYGDTTSSKLPVDVILTDAADRAAVMSALLADVGRNATGLDPARERDNVIVTFTGSVVHATRG